MKTKYLTFLSSLLLTLLTLSCGEDTVDSGFEQNSKLVGSKWTLTTWDYSLGDDYVGLHDETYNFFFYSQTEGAFYYGRKDNYSDQGSSNQRIVCHFTYVVNGDEILLEYITDKYLRTTKLRLNGNILLADQLEFVKESISYTDTQWLNTVHGTTGSCSWYSDMNGTLWILGEGAMADYVSYSATPWGKSNRTPDRVVIGEGVTAIGSYAFANPSVAEVDWPDISLKQIGEAAFKGSTIKDMWMSNSVTSIGKDAFADCEYLKHVSIPDDIVSIGECAFSGCAIHDFILEFGSNLRTIGTFAFEGGHASYLIFKEGVQSISTGAFIGDFCSISEELLLPNSLKSIGATVFEGPYKKIVIGTGVTEIGEKAFISGATSGEMYINLSTPPSVGDNIIVERQGWNSAESRWTLYVPKGCKSAYSNKSPWNKFKSIVEDSSLEGGNANNGSGNETENEDGNGDENVNTQIKVDYKNLSYIADGKPYKMILVDGGTLAPFYIMQTEVPVLGYIQIGDTYIGAIDMNADQMIIKSELRKFIEKLNEVTGLEFRLPTEAEWKFAAKGGVKSKNYVYCGSDNINDVAWYKGNSTKPNDIATKQPNELGLYDMSGNYSEVCSDDPVGIDGRTYGGCWKYEAFDCTPTSWESGNTSAGKIPGTSIRHNNAIDGRYITVRLVYSVPE